MFDALSTRLQDVFQSLGGEVRLTPETTERVLRDIRTALLEADVNLQVVKAFVDRVRDRAFDQAVQGSLSPAQQVVKIVRDELLHLFGDAKGGLTQGGKRPQVILMLGLQGSGKTTTSGKLAAYLKAKGHHPLLAADDLQRPAAVEQLRVLGEQVGVPVYTDPTKVAPHGQVPKGAAVAVARAAVAEAKKTGRDVVILDTAGRLAIDQELMNELKEVNAQVNPHQIYLVLDSMTGQDAVNSAKTFNEQLELDGLILTKLDSDTRGGALLSAKVVTGKPVKFLGMGEKLDAIEEFRPEGMATRILGMGDVIGLVQEAQSKFDMEEQERLTAKMEKGQFTLDDFIGQMGQVKKLGPMSKVLGMLPGMSELTKTTGMGEAEIEKQMGRMRAIYDSMTKEERKKTELLDGQRRRRVARGAGVELNEVSQFMKQFEMSRDMMRAVGGMGMMGKMKLMKSLMGGGLANLGMPGGPMIKTKKSGWQAPKDRNKKKRR